MVKQPPSLLPAPIRLPDVTDEQQAMLDELKARAEHQSRQQVGLVAAMLRLKKPIARRGKTARKARKTTKHVKHMRQVSARVEFLKLDAAMAECAESTTPGGTWIRGDVA